MRTLVLAWLFLAGLAAAAFAQEIPAPKGFVTDETNMMKPADRISLEEKLTAYHARRSVEIAVVLVQSLQGIPLDEYTRRLFDAWRVGRSGFGVVLLVAPPEGVARIYYSQTLRAALTDADCDAIIRTEMVPEFSKGQVSTGVVRGADALIRKIEEGASRFERTKLPRSGAEEEDGSLGSVLCVGLVLIGVVLLFMNSRPGGKLAKGGRKGRR
jgi:uncharacterized protein